MGASFIQSGITLAPICEDITFSGIDACSKSKILLQDNSPPDLLIYKQTILIYYT